ncbi:MAG TPA: hypothetical protein PKV86_06075 [Syntrophobacteraceae bacterium]|nr:hypothetical protein [Syntrophobacteraceae bacterium]
MPKTVDMRPAGANAVELSGTSLRGAVTPAKAGVQKILKSLDSGFRRNDAQGFSGEVLYLTSTTLSPAHDCHGLEARTTG